MINPPLQEDTKPIPIKRGAAFYRPRPSLKHRAFIAAMRLFEKSVRLISEDLYFKIAASVLSELNCAIEFPTRAGPILMRSPSETARIRAKRAPTREPDTLAWIDGFDNGDVLWDIGANVGVFTLYAAKVAGVRVAAFELLPWNYSILINNLTLNRLHDKVSAFCVGITDRIAPVTVSIPLTADTWGGAGGQVNSEIDGFGNPVPTLYRMAALGYTVDGLAALDGMPFPNHIKMDIDGNEDKMLAGARRTLADNRIKSLMFEFQPGNAEAMTKEVEALGYGLSKVVFPNHFFVQRGRQGSR